MSVLSLFIWYCTTFRINLIYYTFNICLLNDVEFKVNKLSTACAIISLTLGYRYLHRMRIIFRICSTYWKRTHTFNMVFKNIIKLNQIWDNWFLIVNTYMQIWYMNKVNYIMYYFYTAYKFQPFSNVLPIFFIEIFAEYGFSFNITTRKSTLPWRNITRFIQMELNCCYI